MEQLQEVFGISNAQEIATQAFIALYATLILFFVVAPVMGAMLSRVVARWQDGVLVGSVATLVILAGNFLLNLLLRALIPVAQLSDIAITILSFTAALALALLLVRYLHWWLMPPGRAAWVLEDEALSEEELMPFERKRRQWQERRKRSQHRY